MIQYGGLQILYSRSLQYHYSCSHMSAIVLLSLVMLITSHKIKSLLFIERSLLSPAPLVELIALSEALEIEKVVVLVITQVSDCTRRRATQRWREGRSYN